MFFECFHGGGPRAREERIWILHLLGRGMRTAADLAMCKHRHVLPLILSLHDSQLADAPTRRACVAVLTTVAEVAEGAAQLLCEHGVPAWIASNAMRESTTADVAPAYVALLLLLLRSAAAETIDLIVLIQVIIALRYVWELANRPLGPAAAPPPEEPAAEKLPEPYAPPVPIPRGADYGLPPFEYEKELDEPPVDAAAALKKKLQPPPLRAATPMARAIAEPCARALVAMTVLPVGDDAWEATDPTMLRQILSCGLTRPATGTDDGVVAPSVRCQLLDTIAEMDRWDNSQRDRDAVAAVALAHTCIALLLECLPLCIEGHGLTLIRGTRAVVGFVVWLERSCFGSTAFRVAMSESETIVANLNNLHWWSDGPGRLAPVVELSAEGYGRSVHFVTRQLNRILTFVCAKRGKCPLPEVAPPDPFDAAPFYFALPTDDVKIRNSACPPGDFEHESITESFSPSKYTVDALGAELEALKVAADAAAASGDADAARAGEDKMYELLFSMLQDK